MIIILTLIKTLSSVTIKVIIYNNILLITLIIVITINDDKDNGNKSDCNITDKM